MKLICQKQRLWKTGKSSGSDVKFKSVFNKNDGLSETSYRLRTNHVIGDLICVEDEILSLLLNLDVTKSSGPDGISSRILKECARELAPSLTYLFNISLSTGELPDDWKKANVVPVHKSGERILAENYRPVSLTSVVVKTLERVVHKHIMNFLIDQQLLSENQHGFRRYRSCLTQLLQLLHHWLSVLNKRGAIDVAF